MTTRRANPARARQWLTALMAITAAIIIGCGGGGGGGTTGLTSTATASTSTASTSTASTSTATASTSTATASTSTASTSTATTSTSSTSTATTSTSTTSTSTTAGGLPPNVIFYTVVGLDESEVRYVSPDGAQNQLFARISNNFGAVALNPAVAGQVVFAHRVDENAKFGLYRNTSVSMTGATQIIAPTFDSVDSLQVSNDGNFVYFVADRVTVEGTLFRVPINGGTRVQIDKAESAHVSPDGTTVVYTKLASNGNAVLFRKPTDLSDTGIAITEDTYNSEFPQWSKDGLRIVFSSDMDNPGAAYDLYTMAAGGGEFRRITNTPEAEEIGGSFNSDATLVSFVGIDVTPGLSGVFRAGAAGLNVNRTMLVQEDAIGSTTYWTSNSGRSRLTARALHLERLRKARRGR